MTLDDLFPAKVEGFAPFVQKSCSRVDTYMCRRAGIAPEPWLVFDHKWRARLIYRGLANVRENDCRTGGYFYVISL